MKIKEYIGHGMIWSFIIVNIAILSNIIAYFIKDKITEQNLEIIIVYFLSGITAYFGYRILKSEGYKFKYKTK